MSLLDAFRLGRNTHERTSAFPAPKFVLDILEKIVTVLDDLAALHTELSADAQTLTDGLAAIKAQVASLQAAQAADPNSADVAAAITTLQTDVAGVHALAQGFATSTAAAASAATAAAAPDPAPSDSTAAAPPADPSTATPAGTLAADVQTGAAAE